VGRKLIWTEEELAQGSPEWFKWRKGEGESGVEMTLGGSEIAPLMYMSPYATPLEVFRQKLGLEEKEFSEAAMDAIERGNRLEPLAREHYEKTFGLAVRTLCAIHPDKPWMRTSLDGITEDNKAILEIKSPRSWDNHVKQTKNGTVPTYRYAQLQWQIAVMREHFPEVERVDYVSFFHKADSGATEVEDGEIPETDMRVIQVFPDERFIEELMRRAEFFINNHLRTGVPTPPTIFIEDGPLIVSHPKPRPKKGVYWEPGLITI
jgi:putative phage-type endonuclease